MPQLDTSSFLSQIFWLVITFTVLYWYLQRFILPKLDGVISQRISKTTGDLKQAEELQNKIVLLEQEIITESHKTNEKIVEMHKEAATRIHAVKQARLDEINVNFIKKQELVKTEIIKAKKAALEQMQDAVIDYAALILTKITGEKPKAGALDQYYLKLEVES